MQFDRSFIGPGALSSLVPALWRQQVDDWPRLGEGIASMRSARTREFRLDGSQVIVQSNAVRATSTAAKVDAASLAARPCFLCIDNLPKSQCAVVYRKEWLILCNPAPILEPHFTITWMKHESQRLEAVLPITLDLARDLHGNYTIFYNGPKSGASAPDHAHLQAGPVATLPFEKELVRYLCSGRTNGDVGWINWTQSGTVRIGVTRPPRRATVVLLGRAKEDLLAAIRQVVEVVGEVQPAEPEPMLNLFATFADECWTVWLHPRRAHRPRCYGTGPEDFLVSPGSIDLAGILIAPRPEDFERIDEGIIAQIYSEVLIAPEQMQRVGEEILSHAKR